jgi:hypothetical protein
MIEIRRLTAGERAHQRGRRDAERGWSPIFRQVGNSIEPSIDDDLADEWDQDVRRAYLDGYYKYDA